MFILFAKSLIDEIISSVIVDFPLAVSPVMPIVQGLRVCADKNFASLIIASFLTSTRTEFSFVIYLLDDWYTEKDGFDYLDTYSSKGNEKFFEWYLGKCLTTCPGEIKEYLELD